jgi:RNA polymerase sigma-70 factor, ECF subfamily
MPDGHHPESAQAFPTDIGRGYRFGMSSIAAASQASAGRFIRSGSHARPSRATGSDAERDSNLIERVRDGDPSAFEEIMAHYKARIFSMTRHLLGNHQDAEEVTQDAFIRALRGLGRFRGDSSFSTWLYRIAINCARNRHSYWSRRKRDSTLSFDAPLRAEGAATLGDVVPAEGGSPYDSVVTDDLLDRIREGMKLLSSDHRQILMLRNVDNVSYEEIAKILAISVGTVKSRIARARSDLRALASVE